VKDTEEEEETKEALDAKDTEPDETMCGYLMKSSASINQGQDGGDIISDVVGGIG